MARLRKLTKVKCPCVVCGKEFEAVRSSAKYCKSPCNAYDAKKRQQATIVPEGHFLELNASETRGNPGANLVPSPFPRAVIKRVKQPKVRHRYLNAKGSPKPWPEDAAWPKETITIYEGEEMYRLPPNSRLQHPNTYQKYLRFGEPGSIAWNEQAIALPPNPKGIA